MLQLKESQATLLVWRIDLKTLQKYRKVVKYIVRGTSPNSQDREVSSALKCFRDNIKISLVGDHKHLIKEIKNFGTQTR